MLILRTHALGLFLVATLFLIQACSDSGNEPIDGGSPRFDKEYSFGKVTVLKDAYYTSDVYVMVAVGYRDSLANGNRNAVIAVLDPGGRVQNTHILDSGDITSIDVVTYDEVSNTFLAAAQGKTSAATFLRYKPVSEELTQYVLPLKGTNFHPTDITPDRMGNVLLSGWVEDGATESGLVASVDSNGVLKWAHYYSATETDVRIEHMAHEAGGMLFACSFRSASSGTAYSRLYKIDFDGNDKGAVDIQIAGLSIVDAEPAGDTAYVLTGSIPLTETVKGGYIGVVDLDGAPTWQGVLGQDSLFVPIRLDYAGYYSIAGNVQKRGINFSITRAGEKYALDGGSTLSWHNEGDYLLNKRYTHPLLLYIGIRRFVYNANKELIESVAYISG